MPLPSTSITPQPPLMDPSPPPRAPPSPLSPPRAAPRTQQAAGLPHGVGSGAGKVEAQAEAPAGGQPQPQRPVLGGEAQPGVPPDPQRVQGAPRAQQPLAPLRPPQRVVRPVPPRPCGQSGAEGLRGSQWSGGVLSRVPHSTVGGTQGGCGAEVGGHREDPGASAPQPGLFIPCGSVIAAARG